MTAKYIYSFAVVVTLLNSVAYGHAVQCAGVTAPAGSYNDFSICTNSQPPSYAPLTETLTSIAAAFVCETACYTRGHSSCSFSVYDASLQTCAIYYSSTPPGPVVDVAPGAVSNTIFLNTICSSITCGQISEFQGHDYLIHCSATSPSVNNLESCLQIYDSSIVPPTGGLFYMIRSLPSSVSCNLGVDDGCHFDPNYDYAVYVGPHGSSYALPMCGVTTTTITTISSTISSTTSATSATSTTSTTTTDTSIMITLTSTTTGLITATTSSTSSSTAVGIIAFDTTTASSSTSTSTPIFSSSITLSVIASPTTTSTSLSVLSSSSSSPASPPPSLSSSSNLFNEATSTISSRKLSSTKTSIFSSPISSLTTTLSTSVLPSSSSSSTVPSADTAIQPTCPRDDGRLYTSPLGNVYEIECDEVAGPHVERSIKEKRQTSYVATTYVTCINSCDFITGCLSIIYNPVSGLCRVFTTFLLPIPGVERGAQLRFLANGDAVSVANTPVSGSNPTASGAPVAVNTNVTVIVVNGININTTTTTILTTTTVLFLGCPVTIICTTGLCGVTTGVCLSCQSLGSSPVDTPLNNQLLGTQVVSQVAGQPSGGSSIMGSSGGGGQQAPSSTQINPASTSTPQQTTNSGEKNGSSLIRFHFIAIIAAILLL